MLWLDFIVLISTLFVCAYIYCKLKFLYWRNKNIPYIEPSFPFGNAGNPFTRKLHPALLLQKQYQHLKSLGHKCGGLFMFVRPSLLAVDVELIKNIMSKDFQHFTDRGTYFNEKDDPLSANLFHLEGHRWKPLRAKLTPTFTSGKLKMMFPTMVACGDPLVAAVKDYALNKKTIDIKDILARFTTDVIGSVAFGLECNSFNEPESEFRKYGKMILATNTKLDIIKMIFAFTSPKIARLCGFSIFSVPKKFFMDVVRKTVSHRKENKVVRNDFVQLLMNLESEDGTEGLTIQQLAAQAYVFWFAGFETSSTTMTFCLYELSSNQNIQDKVREEICMVLKEHNGNLSYDAITDMKYLSQAVDETLRKYPPGIMVPRECVQDYHIPNTNYFIEKGTHVAIPIYPLHYDSDFFPKPDVFEPDRFSDANKGRIQPFTYMPFGEGPRSCIGIRFGLLQAKLGLAILLKNFKFLLNRRTRIPLEFDKFTLIPTATGGIWLDVEQLP